MEAENLTKRNARGLVYDRVRKAYARIRAEATGGWVKEDGQLLVCACPFTDLFNGLVSPAWPEGSAENLWRRAVAWYKRTGQDMYLSLGPSTRPASLRALAERHGFRQLSMVPFMHLDLADLRAYPAVTGLRVERIVDFSFFEKHEHPWLGPVKSPYREVKLQFLRQYGEGEKPRLWQFAALYHRQLVGGATVFVHGEEMAVFDVVVEDQFRKRGIGTSLVGEACRFLRERGIRAAGLGASGEGIGLYRKLGFKDAGAFPDLFLAQSEVAQL